MWFKQLKLFRFSGSLSSDSLSIEHQLQAMAFEPCLASLPDSYGWASPLAEEDESLLHASRGYYLICMQIEEKLLPATVVKQAVDQKVKEIEALQDRKVFRKEKTRLKEEMTQQLLPLAFSKFSRIYAFFDRQNHYLLVNTSNSQKLEKFQQLFKRSFPGLVLEHIETKKLAPILTRWLLNQDFPSALSLGNACQLFDPAKASSQVRCQQLDLNITAIQELVQQENYQVKQLALKWQEQLSFVLTEDFVLKSIQYDDQLLSEARSDASETAAQQFDADFIIMSESLTKLISELMPEIADGSGSNQPERSLAQMAS